MFKYQFTGENKHSMIVLYIEHKDYFLTYFYEDYEGSYVTNVVSSNILPLNISVDNNDYHSDNVIQLRNIFLQKYIDLSDNSNIPDHIINAVRIEILKYFII